MSDDGAARDWALPAPEEILVDGRTMRIRRTRNAGVPVLLLHGIGCSLEDWDEQFALLGPRFSLLAPDLPGFGWSAPLPDTSSASPSSTGTDHLTRWAGSMDRLLDVLGIIGPVHVIGNSLGGAVAMAFAATFPGRVASLILVDPAGFGRQVTPALRAIAVPYLGRVLLHPDPRASARTVRSLFADPALATPARVDHALALARRPAHTKTLRRAAGELGSAFGTRAGWRRRLLAGLAAVQAPILVVWGDQDRILPSTQLAAAAAALPSATTHRFPATGHMPQIERPQEFAALAADHIARATPTDRATSTVPVTAPTKES